MTHVIALIIAAGIWIGLGWYLLKAMMGKQRWTLVSYVAGGLVFSWYEIHMYWYWLVLGVALISLPIFARLKTT